MGSHIRDILADSFRRTRPFTRYKFLRFIVGMTFPNWREFIFYYYHFAAVRFRTAKLNAFNTGMVIFHFSR